MRSLPLALALLAGALPLGGGAGTAAPLSGVQYARVEPLVPSTYAVAVSLVSLELWHDRPASCGAGEPVLLTAASGVRGSASSVYGVGTEVGNCVANQSALHRSCDTQAELAPWLEVALPAPAPVSRAVLKLPPSALFNPWSVFRLGLYSSSGTLLWSSAPLSGVEVASFTVSAPAGASSGPVTCYSATPSATPGLAATLPPPYFLDPGFAIGVRAVSDTGIVRRRLVQGRGAADSSSRRVAAPALSAEALVTRIALAPPAPAPGLRGRVIDDLNSNSSTLSRLQSRRVLVSHVRADGTSVPHPLHPAAVVAAPAAARQLGTQGIISGDVNYTVPAGVTLLYVSAWGAGGGGGTLGLGGAGAYVAGFLPVTPGETLLVRIGAGGFKGGSGGSGGASPPGALAGGSGGSATTISRVPASGGAATVLVTVAGGGGGGREPLPGGAGSWGPAGHRAWDQVPSRLAGAVTAEVGGASLYLRACTAGGGNAGGGGNSSAGTPTVGGASCDGSTASSSNGAAASYAGGGGGAGAGGGGGAGVGSPSGGGGGGSSVGPLLLPVGEDSWDGPTPPGLGSPSYPSPLLTYAPTSPTYMFFDALLAQYPDGWWRGVRRGTPGDGVPSGWVGIAQGGLPSLLDGAEAAVATRGGDGYVELAADPAVTLAAIGITAKAGSTGTPTRAAASATPGASASGSGRCPPLWTGPIEDKCFIGVGTPSSGNSVVPRVGGPGGVPVPFSPAAASASAAAPSPATTTATAARSWNVREAAAACAALATASGPLGGHPASAATFRNAAGALRLAAVASSSQALVLLGGSCGNRIPPGASFFTGLFHANTSAAANARVAGLAAASATSAATSTAAVAATASASASPVSAAALAAARTSGWAWLTAPAGAAPGATPAPAPGVDAGEAFLFSAPVVADRWWHVGEPSADLLPPTSSWTAAAADCGVVTLGSPIRHRDPARGIGTAPWPRLDNVPCSGAGASSSSGDGASPSPVAPTATFPPELNEGLPWDAVAWACCELDVTAPAVSPSPTGTPSRTSSATGSRSVTPSRSVSPSITPTSTRSATTTVTATASPVSPTPTASRSVSATPTSTLSRTPTGTRTLSLTASPTRSRTATPSAYPSVTPTYTPSASPSQLPGSQCPTGFSHSSWPSGDPACYLGLTGTFTSVSVAATMCSLRGGFLPSITNAYQLNHVLSQSCGGTLAPDATFYLGLTDRFNESVSVPDRPAGSGNAKAWGGWEWMDGASNAYATTDTDFQARWGTGQPTDSSAYALATEGADYVYVSGAAGNRQLFSTDGLPFYAPTMTNLCCTAARTWPSPTPTPSVTRTRSPSPVSPTPTSSATSSGTATVTRSATGTASRSASGSSTRSGTPSGSRTPTGTATPSMSLLPSASEAPTPSTSCSPSASASASRSGTPSASLTASTTASATSSTSATASATASGTPSRSITPSCSPSVSATPSVTPSSSAAVVPCSGNNSGGGSGAACAPLAVSARLSPVIARLAAAWDIAAAAAWAGTASNATGAASSGSGTLSEEGDALVTARLPAAAVGKPAPLTLTLVPLLAPVANFSVHLPFPPAPGEAVAVTCSVDGGVAAESNNGTAACAARACLTVRSLASSPSSSSSASSQRFDFSASVVLGTAASWGAPPPGAALPGGDVVCTLTSSPTSSSGGSALYAGLTPIVPVSLRVVPLHAPVVAAVILESGYGGSAVTVAAASSSSGGLQPAAVGDAPDALMAVTVAAAGRPSLRAPVLLSSLLPSTLQNTTGGAPATDTTFFELTLAALLAVFFGTPTNGTVPAGATAAANATADAPPLALAAGSGATAFSLTLGGAANLTLVAAPGTSFLPPYAWSRAGRPGDWLALLPTVSLGGVPCRLQWLNADATLLRVTTPPYSALCGATPVGENCPVATLEVGFAAPAAASDSSGSSGTSPSAPSIDVSYVPLTLACPPACPGLLPSAPGAASSGGVSGEWGGGYLAAREVALSPAADTSASSSGGVRRVQAADANVTGNATALVTPGVWGTLWPPGAPLVASPAAATAAVSLSSWVAAPAVAAAAPDPMDAAAATAAAAASSGILLVPSCSASGQWTPPESGRCLDPTDPGSRACAFGMADVCVPCPEGALCPGGFRAWPLPGYYTPAEASGVVLRCAAPATERCLGWDPLRGAVRCGRGYRPGSPACASCDAGWYPADEGGGQCLPCPGLDGGSLVASRLAASVPVLRVVGILTAIAAGMFAVVLGVTYKVGGTLKGGLRRAASFVLSSTLLLQALIQTARALPPGLPPGPSAFFSALKVLQFESITLHPACLGGGPFGSDPSLFVFVLLLLGGVTAAALLLERAVLCPSRAALARTAPPCLRRGVLARGDGSSSTSCGFVAAAAAAVRRGAAIVGSPFATALSRCKAGRFVLKRLPSTPRLTLKAALVLLSVLYALTANKALRYLYCVDKRMSLPAYIGLGGEGLAVVAAGLASSGAETAALAALVRRCTVEAPWVPACREPATQRLLSRSLTVPVLHADPHVVCWESGHTAVYRLALATLLLYIVAFPLVSLAYAAFFIRRVAAVIAPLAWKQHLHTRRVRIAFAPLLAPGWAAAWLLARWRRWRGSSAGSSVTAAPPLLPRPRARLSFAAARTQGARLAAGATRLARLSVGRSGSKGPVLGPRKGSVGASGGGLLGLVAGSNASGSASSAAPQSSLPADATSTANPVLAAFAAVAGASGGSGRGGGGRGGGDADHVLALDTVPSILRHPIVSHFGGATEYRPVVYWMRHIDYGALLVLAIVLTLWTPPETHAHADAKLGVTVTVALLLATCYVGLQPLVREKRWMLWVRAYAAALTVLTAALSHAASTGSAPETLERLSNLTLAACIILVVFFIAAFFLGQREGAALEEAWLKALKARARLSMRSGRFKGGAVAAGNPAALARGSIALSPAALAALATAREAAEVGYLKVCMGAPLEDEAATARTAAATATAVAEGAPLPDADPLQSSASEETGSSEVAPPAPVRPSAAEAWSDDDNEEGEQEGGEGGGNDGASAPATATRLPPARATSMSIPLELGDAFDAFGLDLGSSGFGGRGGGGGGLGASVRLQSRADTEERAGFAGSRSSTLSQSRSARQSVASLSSVRGSARLSAALTRLSTTSAGLAWAPSEASEAATSAAGNASVATVNPAARMGGAGLEAATQPQRGGPMPPVAPPPGTVIPATLPPVAAAVMRLPQQPQQPALSLGLLAPSVGAAAASGTTTAAAAAFKREASRRRAAGTTNVLPPLRQPAAAPPPLLGAAATGAVPRHAFAPSAALAAATGVAVGGAPALPASASLPAAVARVRAASTAAATPLGGSGVRATAPGSAGAALPPPVPPTAASPPSSMRDDAW